MLALDTEDNQRGQPWIINFYNGKEHVTFEGPDCRIGAITYLEKIGPERIWCCNAEYDLINLFGPYIGKLCTLQYVSAGFLRATTVFRQTILDTVRHWPASVQEMGKIIGLEKLDVGHDFINVDYCRRDTEIVYYFVKEMVSRYERLGLKLKSTMPSMALQMFCRLGGNIQHALTETETSWLRDSYYGGRVECYRVGEISGSIHNYDFNSLFPSVMIGHDYPDVNGPYEWIDSIPDYGAACCTVEVPFQPYPPLPVHGNSELVYPYGVFTGTWSVNELHYAINHCGVKVRKVHEALSFKKTVRPFDLYVRICYDERLKAKTLVDKMFWKGMLNSLYGKFGQWSGIECIHNDRSMVLHGSAKHVNVIWSSYTTAYARTKLHKSLIACSDVYYTDTDSLFTPDTLPVSEKLGELKLEGTESFMKIVGNKIYVYGQKAKAKGVPKVSALEFCSTGRAVYRRPVRYRMSRRSLLRPNYWCEFEKVLRTEYTKRKVLGDNSTVPWEYTNYLTLTERN